MEQFESFSSYFGRLVTFQDFIWITFLMFLAFMIRKPLARALKVSNGRYLLIALSFAGLIGLSLRFWVASGTESAFWLWAPEVRPDGLHLNANLVLNILLYTPPALLLVLAQKSWWKVFLALGCLSFLAETIQQYARIGSGDPMDWFANGLGAAIGAAIGLVLAKLWPTVAVKATH